MSRENCLIHLDVGGKLFQLEPATIDALGSEFLNKLVDQSTPFRKPYNGNSFRVLEAEPTIFSDFVHLAKHGIPGGSLVSDKEKEAVQKEADFWGITSEVEEAIRQANAASRVLQRELLRYKAKKRWRGVIPMTKSTDLIHCSVCGVRWTAFQQDVCELNTCPFQLYWFDDRSDRTRIRYCEGYFDVGRQHYFSMTRWWVCIPCGEKKRPDLAMGSHWCEREGETLTACYKCAGNCDGSCARRFWR